MLRGTCWHAALVLAWGLWPIAVQAQNMVAGPPAANFGPVMGMGGGGGCASCGLSLPTTMGNKCCHFCCPRYHHCAEGPVRICFHSCCAKPVCNPCDLPHFGYWQKCWNPWPYPPDWSHCPTPPPAAYVKLNPYSHYLPGPTPTPPLNASPRFNQDRDEDLPPPRSGDGVRPGFDRN
jgi:hypothetical protein